jgi:nitrogen regulatory protein PII
LGVQVPLAPLRFEGIELRGRENIPYREEVDFMLKKVECFIQPFKLDEIKEALIEVGVEGMSVLEARGFGRQRGHLQKDKKNKSIKFLNKVKLEIVVDEEIVEEVMDTIKKLARTGTIGAGKIFVVPVEDAIRISTDEVGKSAIY